VNPVDLARTVSPRTAGLFSISIGLLAMALAVVLDKEIVQANVPSKLVQALFWIGMAEFVLSVVSSMGWCFDSEGNLTDNGKRLSGIKNLVALGILITVMVSAFVVDWKVTKPELEPGSALSTCKDSEHYVTLIVSG
jgi:hypothetical protein